MKRIALFFASIAALVIGGGAAWKW